MPHQETVGVSAVLVELTEGFQPENGSCSTRGLLWEAGSMLQEGADLTEGVATVAPSPVVRLGGEVSRERSVADNCWGGAPGRFC